MTTVRTIVLALVALFLLSSSAHAQTIARWDFKIFNAGAPSPISTTPVPFASAVCNLATGPAGNNTVNPTDLWWNDPNVTGRWCHYVSQPGDPLITMPITGNPLEGALAAVSTTNTSSLDSTRAPFTKPGTAPAVPTGFTLR